MSFDFTGEQKGLKKFEFMRTLRRFMIRIHRYLQRGGVRVVYSRVNMFIELMLILEKPMSGNVTLV